MNVSNNKFESLWLDWTVLLLLSVFFLLFNSVFYQINIQFEIDQSIQKEIEEFDMNDGKSYRKAKQGVDEHDINPRAYERQDEYAQKEYVEKIDRKLLVRRLYHNLTYAILFTSTILSLVSLLIISFQIRGIFHFFYICF
jgi:hypothetical protein